MEFIIKSRKYGEIIVLIDEDDFEKVSKHKWRVLNDTKRNVLYIRTSYWEGEQRKDLFIHRLIMNTPKGLMTDHINGNPLDNRKSNLRICTNSENQHNSIKHRGNKTSIYKGVSYYKRDKNWECRIIVNKEPVRLGKYKTEDQAALAYNVAALQHFGEFARFNNVMAHRGI